MHSLVENKDNKCTQKIVHDINSSISALQEGMDVIKDEWKVNPDLVNRLLPLMLDKINQVQKQITHYQNHSI